MDPTPESLPSQPITVDQLSTKKPEIPKNAFIPMLLLNSVKQPNKPISPAIANEVQRASLSTLKLLGIDISKYQGDSLKIEDLVNINEVDKAGKLTLKRKDGSDKNALVLVLSANPLNTGLTEDDKILLDTTSLDRYILNSVPSEVKAGMLSVQETIHYVQHVYWKRPIHNNIDSIHNEKLHNQDPLEKEMYPLWVKICQLLYK